MAGVHGVWRTFKAWCHTLAIRQPTAPAHLSASLKGALVHSLRAFFSVASADFGEGGGGLLQGYLTHKKQPPPRTLQWDYTRGRMVVLGGGCFE